MGSIFREGIKALFQIRKKFGYIKILLIFTTSQIIDLRYKLEHIIGNKYG